MATRDVMTSRRTCAEGGSDQPLTKRELVVSHSTWINAQDLLSERQVLRKELARLRAENERLRGALVDEVAAEMHEASEHRSAKPCAASTGC